RPTLRSIPKRRAPSATSSECLQCSITARASSQALARSRTPATAPTARSRERMIPASTSSSPAEVMHEPRPALKVGSSSSTRTAAIAASTQASGSSGSMSNRLASPTAAAARVPDTAASCSSAAQVPAPPWTTMIASATTNLRSPPRRVGSRRIGRVQGSKHATLERVHGPTLGAGAVIVAAQVGEPVDQQHGGLVEQRRGRAVASLALDGVPVEHQIAEPELVELLIGRLGNEREHVGRPGLAHELEVQLGHLGVVDDPQAEPGELASIDTKPLRRSPHAGREPGEQSTIDAACDGRGHLDAWVREHDQGCARAIFSNTLPWQNASNRSRSSLP